jgi:hypothetical protein
MWDGHTVSHFYSCICIVCCDMYTICVLVKYYSIGDLYTIKLDFSISGGCITKYGFLKQIKIWIWKKHSVDCVSKYDSLN